MTDKFTKFAPQNMYGPCALGACIFVLVLVFFSPFFPSEHTV